MSLVITVNRKEMYRGVIGTHAASLTIHVTATLFSTRVSLAYVSNDCIVSEVIG